MTLRAFPGSPPGPWPLHWLPASASTLRGASDPSPERLNSLRCHSNTLDLVVLVFS